MPRDFFSCQRNSVINRRINKGKCIWPSRCNFPCDTQKSQFSFPWLHCLEFCSVSWMALGSPVSSIYLTTVSALHFQAGGFFGFVDTIGIVLKGLLIFFFLLYVLVGCQCHSCFLCFWMSDRKWYLNFEVFVNVHHRSLITSANLGKKYALTKKKYGKKEHMQS